MNMYVCFVLNKRPSLTFAYMHLAPISYFSVEATNVPTITRVVQLYKKIDSGAESDDTMAAYSESSFERPKNNQAD